MLQLVSAQSQPRIARYEPAWEELDEAHAAIWHACRHLFPANAMVDQTDYGCLLVSWPLRGKRRRSSHFAAPVIIRIAAGLLVVLWTSDDETRRDIASLEVEKVSNALAEYDPYSRTSTCGVIELGD